MMNHILSGYIMRLKPNEIVRLFYYSMIKGRY